MTRIYNKIGQTYNATRKADPFITNVLTKYLVKKDEGIFLDIGCGTGNYTTALTHKGFVFTGVDPSETMLAVAKERSSSEQWLQGTAENIPAADAIFDGAIATLTIHHWTDINFAFKEIARVLKLKARLVVFTATPQQMHGYWLNHYFPKMLKESIAKMPELKTIENAATKAGFIITAQEKYFVQPSLQDLFLYSGKHDPSLYFDKKIREGISSFAVLSNKEEVEAGLYRLKEDIKTKKFESIKESFRNDHGDYLFLCFEKL